MASLKVFDTSIYNNEKYQKLVLSNLNSTINNLEKERSRIVSLYSININCTERILELGNEFDQLGGVQSIALDAICYSVINFEDFMRFFRIGVLNGLCQKDHVCKRNINASPDLREELNVLKDALSSRFAKISREALIGIMVEFLLENKDPRVITVDLPVEVSFISCKMKEKEGSNHPKGKGFSRRLINYVYCKILAQMMRSLYTRSEFEAKDNEKLQLPIFPLDAPKDVTETPKDCETQQGGNDDMIMMNSKPANKLDLSLLKHDLEEEKTMKDAINTFMVGYGNRYVYEEEAKLIVSLLNKVSNNSISLTALKAAL